jgi:DNA-binding NarL/FixJ family response regulator
MVTPRQLDILRLAGDGLEGPAIAERLGLTLETVRWHRRRLLVRLGARNMAHAYALAFRAGIL